MFCNTICNAIYTIVMMCFFIYFVLCNAFWMLFIICLIIRYIIWFLTLPFNNAHFLRYCKISSVSLYAYCFVAINMHFYPYNTCSSILPHFWNIAICTNERCNVSLMLHLFMITFFFLSHHIIKSFLHSALLHI